MAKHQVFGDATGQVIGTDKVIFSNGDDVIDFRGTDGDWRVYAGAGNDYIHMNGGDNFVDAGSGNDRVTGGGGADLIYGGAGNDVLNGARGDDVVHGGDGIDIIFMGAAVGLETDNDIVSGGSGGDAFYFNADFGNDTITDYGDGDVLALSADATYSYTQVGNDLIITVSGSAEGTITLLNTTFDEVTIEHPSSYVDLYHSMYM